MTREEAERVAALLVVLSPPHEWGIDVVVCGRIMRREWTRALAEATADEEREAIVRMLVEG